MAKYNSTILLILIAMAGLAVIVSGCVNSSEPTQKTQPISSPTQIPTEVVINLHAQQIILNDTEIRDVLGNDFTKNDQEIVPLTDDDGASSNMWVNYAGPEANYQKNWISIQIMVIKNFENANILYPTLGTQISNGGVKNKIKIGNTEGELYSGIGKNESNPIGSSMVMFSKNNIIVFVKSAPNIEIETLLELARMQEAKIARILEMIQ